MAAAWPSPDRRGCGALWCSDSTANSIDDFKVRDIVGPYEVDGRYFAADGGCQAITHIASLGEVASTALHRHVMTTGESVLETTQTHEQDEQGGHTHCCACDYILDGLHDTRCPECGRPFDPGDPTTVARHSISRRLWLRWAIPRLSIFIGLALVLGLLAWAWSQIDSAETIEVCTTCGAVARYREWHINGLCIYETEREVTHTNLAKFLRSSERAHEHVWKQFIVRHFDSDGREIFPREESERPGYAYIVNDSYARRPLEIISETMPPIQNMIRQDILRARNPSAALRNAAALAAMCEDPSEENVRRVIQWWIYDEREE